MSKLRGIYRKKYVRTHHPAALERAADSTRGVSIHGCLSLFDSVVRLPIVHSGKLVDDASRENVANLGQKRKGRTSGYR